MRGMNSRSQWKWNEKKVTSTYTLIISEWQVGCGIHFYSLLCVDPLVFVLRGEHALLTDSLGPPTLPRALNRH